jgi:hypothetical protein
MDPKQKLEIDKRFLEQNMIIETMRSENSILEQTLHDKEMEILRLKDSTQENQQAPKSQNRDASMRERLKHTKAMKSKAREISRLKTDIASINKNFMNLKATTMTVQQAKSEKEKDRLKISDLLRQRSALESQTNTHKTDMFNKEKEQTNQRSEIEKLKQLLEIQKTSNNKQKLEIEKYIELYNNAKATTTPFSDSRVDYMTEATHGMKNTPTDMKTFGGKNIHISSKIDTKSKPTPTSNVIAQDKSTKEEIEKKLDESFEEIPEKSYEDEKMLSDDYHQVNEDIVSEDIREKTLDVKDNTIDEIQEEVKDERVSNKHEEEDEDDKYTTEEDIMDTKNSPEKSHLSMNQSEASLHELISITEPPKPDIPETPPKYRTPSPKTPSKHSHESMSELESKTSKASLIKDNNHIFKNRVSIIDIPMVAKIEFRLILQNQKIPFEKMHEIFPNTKRVGLNQLIKHFKSFGRFENDYMLEQICRYLVENDAVGDVIKYNETTDIDKIAIGKITFVTF